MLRQADNKVTIEGILNSINLEYGENDKGRNIRGSFNVLVEIGDTVNEIPVHVYAGETTKAGGKNPSFASIEKVMGFTSIAASDKNTATRVRVSGNLAMNEYYSPDGRLISFPRVRGSFVNIVKASEFNPRAEFEVEMVVAQIKEEIDSAGNDTGRLSVTGIIPQYGETVDVFPMVASMPSVISGINSCWEKNATVRACGNLDFSSTTTTKKVQLGFGAEKEETKTISKSELVINAGSEPYEGGLAFAPEDIKTALDKRKVHLEEEKVKAENKAKTTPKASASGALDLGF